MSNCDLQLFFSSSFERFRLSSFFEVNESLLRDLYSGLLIRAAPKFKALVGALPTTIDRYCCKTAVETGR